jgi:hypothetical protein
LAVAEDKLCSLCSVQSHDYLHIYIRSPRSVLVISYYSSCRIVIPVHSTGWLPTSKHKTHTFIHFQGPFMCLTQFPSTKAQNVTCVRGLNAPLPPPPRNVNTCSACSNNIRNKDTVVPADNITLFSKVPYPKAEKLDVVHGP